MTFDRTFFVTTVTAARLPILRHKATANLLINTIAHYRDEGKYLLHEFVIMPDHIHLLLTPSDELSLERAIQFIKGGFRSASNAATSGSRVSQTTEFVIRTISSIIANTSG